MGQRVLVVQNVKEETWILFPNVFKAVTSLIQIGIEKLNGSTSTCATSIFKDPNVAAKRMSYDKYVAVLADEATSTIDFFVKITLHRRLDKGIRYWQFTCQP